MGGVINFCITVILFSIVIEDMKYHRISNYKNILLLLIGVYLNKDFIEKSVLGAAIYATPYMLVYGYLSDILKKEAIGFGDVKLSFSLGGLLGYTDIKSVMDLFFRSFFLASIYIIFLYVFKGLKKREFPFSPFIILSFLSIEVL